MEPFLYGGLGLLPLATLCRMPEDGVRVMHESTAYDMILDEGRIEGEIRLLLRQGRKRFGPPDPPTESALTATKDLERLERMGEAVLTVNSWQELLATP